VKLDLGNSLLPPEKRKEKRKSGEAASKGASIFLDELNELIGDDDGEDRGDS
jgi:hypothetical protein